MKKSVGAKKVTASKAAGAAFVSDQARSGSIGPSVGPRGGAPVTDSGSIGAMIGPAVIVVVLIVAIPVGVLMSTGVLAGVLGYFLNDDVDRSHEGSELLETNV